MPTVRLQSGQRMVEANLGAEPFGFAAECVEQIGSAQRHAEGARLEHGCRLVQPRQALALAVDDLEACCRDAECRDAVGEASRSQRIDAVRRERQKGAFGKAVAAARLEHRHLMTGLAKPDRQRQPGNTGADDRDRAHVAGLSAAHG